jgi:transcriptional regulator with XRE-family HTH domain
MKTEKALKNILVLIGARLANLREKRGFTTIKEFTHKFDLPEIQYWRIEKGKANITIKSLVKILNIHHISLPDFFCLLAEDVD